MKKTMRHLLGTTLLSGAAQAIGVAVAVATLSVLAGGIVMVGLLLYGAGLIGGM